MRWSPRWFGMALMTGLALAAPSRAAITVDGLLDLDYGPPLATQTTQTSFVDATPAFSPNPALYADGSELDAVHGFIADGVLHMWIAGNVGFCCPTMYSHQEELDLFFDSRPGGQPVLRSDNAAVGWFSGTTLNGLAGLRFDVGFEPDYWVGCTVNMSSAWAELLTAGGGVGRFLGSNTVGAPGTLSGGSNPDGVLAAIDNSNGAGVTAGCAAGSGSDVSTGVEWAIPLAAIGNPGGCVRVCVMVANAESHALGNQFLAPLPPGTCALGAPAAVDLGSVAGEQFVTICPAATPAQGGTWGRLKTLYR